MATRSHATLARSNVRAPRFMRGVCLSHVRQAGSGFAGNWSVAVRTGATPKSVVPTGNRAPALASRKERSGYRNLILTISPRKKRRRRNSPNAETANHDHPRHAHAPSAGVRRPRMSRLGGKATAVLASLLRFNVAWVRGRSGIRRPAGVGRRFDVSGGVVCPRHLGNVTRARMVA